MAAVIAALAVIVVILLLLLPVGVRAEYENSGFTLGLFAGSARFAILPRSGKQKREKKEKPQKQKQTDTKKPKLKPDREDIFSLIKSALGLLGSLRRRLCLDELRLRLDFASPDPCDTAVGYGRVCAALGAGLPFLHQAVNIKKEDIAVAPDFDSEKSTFEAAVCARLRVWDILALAVLAVRAVLPWYMRLRKKARAASAAEV